MTTINVNYDPFAVLFYLGITIVAIFLLCLGFVLWVFRKVNDNLEEPEFESCEIDAFDYTKVEEDLR